ncbi:MAG TPA: GIY-YIG nuclease family protein [Cyclobacteriaceae bacterium]|nr:GIY-YIG nuclease family protein [Cyclobacteriaceae bacterium]
MFYAYILQSEQTGTFYYGSTKDVEDRLRQHNSGKVRSTKSKRPWKLIYSETFQTKSEAFKKELYFKSIEGYRFLKESGITTKK